MTDGLSHGTMVSWINQCFSFLWIEDSWVASKTGALYSAHTPHAAASVWKSMHVTCSLLTTFTYILCQVVHMSRNHMVGCVDRCGQQNAVLVTLMDLPNDSKHNEATFSTISTTMLYWWVAPTPRSPDLVIFVLMTTGDRQNRLFYSLHMHAAQGNKFRIVSLLNQLGQWLLNKFTYLTSSYYSTLTIACLNLPHGRSARLSDS